MSDKLTPTQFLTLHWMAEAGGKTILLPRHWQNRHHQALIRRGLVRLGADPFTSKAIMLHGHLTARGKKAVLNTPQSVRVQADKVADRNYAKYIKEQVYG